ncbi:MAG TPA: LysR family transcriptional regulator [Gammaproteobacteria bacterium]|nr:LysR family transcriptional regulator [Gammaproteobacteria bacterium]
MTLEQLRIFVAVAEEQHVTRASRALNLTQAATSASIAALESRHGVALFHRVGRGIALTEAGRVLLEEARKVLAAAASAECALRDLSGLKRGHLCVHASQTIASYWLPAKLQRFRASCPGVTLSVGIGNTQDVAQAVKAGRAEIGFVEGEVRDPSLVAETVARDELLLLVPPDHPWTRQPPTSPAMLLEAVWVLREAGSGTRQRLEVALTDFGVDPAALQVALELPSNEAVRAAVEAGAGVTVLSRLVAGGALLAGTLYAVPFALPDRSFQLLRHRQRSVSAAAAAFRTLLYPAGSTRAGT